MGFRPSVVLAFATLAASACGSPTAPACSGFDYSGTAIVRGRVTYAGAPYVGGGVAVGSHTTVTGADGSFVLENVAPGPQTLSIGSVEGGSATGEVNVIRGDNQLNVPVVWGPDEGVLAGRTLDSCTGRPLAGVRISLAGQSVTTDADGLYSISGLCCGTLPALTAGKIGYQTYTNNLGRLYNRSVWLDIVMVKP